MRSIFSMLLVACLLSVAAGCGGDREKAINKDLDKPKKADDKR